MLKTTPVPGGSGTAIGRTANQNVQPTAKSIAGRQKVLHFASDCPPTLPRPDPTTERPTTANSRVVVVAWLKGGMRGELEGSAKDSYNDYDYDNDYENDNEDDSDKWRRLFMKI
ncbi:hypothetical protein AWZ03_010002 [Drosophila navojoa]|uniref:Uncharacterized protein n=1 Tax=Drosophila navojoa TaxID=7232 RepID=A0A484B4I1_DRONA|nr:hypothetical protein AWZ03_010002 [Drosophila navojoa]